MSSHGLNNSKFFFEESSQMHLVCNNRATLNSVSNPVFYERTKSI